MKNLIFSILFFLVTVNSWSQKYYDLNDFEYFIDFNDMYASLKFQDYVIKGEIEDILSHYGNRYTVIKGDSIHWLLEQSENKNKYRSYLILKGEYKEVQKLAKWEFSGKKLEVLASDRIYSDYFRDYFNFIDEDEYYRYKAHRQIGEYLADANLIGEYKIKVFRDNGINYNNLNIKGTLEINKKGILIKTNLPTLTKFSGYYDSRLNENVNFVKSVTFAGVIENKDGGIFSLNLDFKKKIATLVYLEVTLNSKEVELNTRNTTTFIIED